jgi:hypothetical protein
MLSDLTAFILDHQPHGKLVGDAGEPGRAATAMSSLPAQPVTDRAAHDPARGRGP